jgi:Ca2+-binding EF-hand superfamily protein
MAKAQQIEELFKQFDADHDGEINSDEFGQLVQEMGYEYIYPGTVKKVTPLPLR